MVGASMSHSPGMGHVFFIYSIWTVYGMHAALSSYSEAQMEKPLRPNVDRDSIIFNRYNDDMTNKSSANTLCHATLCYATLCRLEVNHETLSS